MRAAKRLDKLERELVPQLERWKQEILREQQVTSRKLTPQDYRRSYSPEWIRDQSGVRCLWSEAVERYWMRREPAELRKWGLSPSAIENVLNQRPVSMADREASQLQPVEVQTPEAPSVESLEAAVVSERSPSKSWFDQRPPIAAWGPTTAIHNAAARQRKHEMFSRELNRKQQFQRFRKMPSSVAG
jgi:hypothetical protein